MRTQPFTGDERALLVAIARAAISDRLSGEASLGVIASRARVMAAACEELGAFVTLWIPGGSGGAPRLRGCIGTIESTGPLHETVARYACESAFRDPRFPPLEAPELDELSIEISVISRLCPVPGPDAILAGRHGVVLDKPPHHSVFLPQVAAENGWGVDELLARLSVKAGLDRSGWREACLSVFDAEVF